MATALETSTAAISTILRVAIYVFLRWIPTSAVPPALLATFALYAGGFILCGRQTPSLQVVSDEVDVVVKEIHAQDADPAIEAELLPGADDGPRKELDVQQRVVMAPRGPEALRTILTGLPSPVSMAWSAATFGVNVVLVLMAYDLIYSGPVLYPSHDLSFARVGFVSSDSAKILVREPRREELPLDVFYREVEERSFDYREVGMVDVGKKWKSSGPIVSLTNETDFTTVKVIGSLRPDTHYQYRVSNNHTGQFTTPPSTGRLSKRLDGRFTFLHSSCIKPRFPYSPFSHPLSVPGFRHLAKWLPKLKPSFMLFLGDFIYADVPTYLAKDIPTFRREYRQVYNSKDWPAVGSSLSWLHVLDDHEIRNDWMGNSTGIYATAAEPWQHYHVSANPPPVSKGATYFAFTQGPASFFMLDTRRYRNPNGPAGVFNASDEAKTMLGKAQLASLLKWLRKPAPSGVRWKIVISSVPFTRNWRFGSEDSWAGFLVERQTILEAMWSVSANERQGVGVVVLSGDRHEFAATRFSPPPDHPAALSTRGAAPPEVLEFSTSPLSMFYLPYRTYEQHPDGGDVCLKYIPDGNSKFGAVEIETPGASVGGMQEQSVLRYRLFVDGEEAWSYIATTPLGRQDTGAWS